jgi:iron(III) transport system permease protein
MVACVSIVVYLALIPLLILLINSFRSAPIGSPDAYFTFAHYLEAYLDPEYYYLWKNTLLFALGRCLVTGLVGITLAWIYERTNTPFKKTFAVMALIPFVIPGILSTVSWILLLSPKIGLINLFLMKVLHLEKAPFTIYSLYGMVLADGFHHYPLVFLMMAAAFRSMDMALEESATMSGSGTLSTFCRVTLPLMRPAFLAAMVIQFIRGIEAFSAPALIGIPAGIEVFTSKIYLALHRFPPNMGLAGALAVTLLCVSTLGVYLYRRLTGTGERFATVSGKAFRPRVIDLGKFKYLVSAGCLLFFTVTIALPVLIIFWGSLVPYYEIPSLAALSTLSFKNYTFVLKYPLTAQAFRTSIILMLVVPTMTMIFTSIVAWIIVKSKVKGRGILDALAFIPIAFPGIVLGVALIYVYLFLPIPVYGTIWILIIAYVTKMMPMASRFTTATIIQIQDELEEASALSGATWFRTFYKIVMPLLIPGFMAGWIYVAMVALRELSTSILLYSSGTEVLSILIFDLWEGGQYSPLCALGIYMILILVALAYVANKVGARIGIKRVS